MKRKRGQQLLLKHRNMTHIALTFRSLLYTVDPQVDARQVYLETIYKLGRVGFLVSASNNWLLEDNPEWIVANPNE